MEDDNPKEIFWVLSVIGVVEKRRTRECTIYKHGPTRQQPHPVSLEFLELVPS